ncbi:hypothetical protein AI2866V1_4615 (plasmid) [Enterobacter cloacae]|nr:hypothetical protein AI2866V1_4615 [Enterobacter cloacae]CAH5552154.1 hypothetical protein AI2866V1_4615 [Enterobacter cloacae]VAS51919.1 Uncharacterised protein [Klebsiella pneumoniae]
MTALGIRIDYYFPYQTQQQLQSEQKGQILSNTLILLFAYLFLLF